MNVMLNDLADILDVIAEAIAYNEPEHVWHLASRLRKDAEEEIEEIENE
jgi:hypothetical protein